MDDSRKKEKRRLEDNRQRCRRLGIEQPEVERRALARLEEEDAILQDDSVREERRKRCRILMKYYRGMQVIRQYRGLSLRVSLSLSDSGQERARTGLPGGEWGVARFAACQGYARASL